MFFGKGLFRFIVMFFLGGGMGWGGRDWFLFWFCRVVSGVDWSELDLVVDRVGRFYSEWVWERRIDVSYGIE